MKKTIFKTLLTTTIHFFALSSAHGKSGVLAHALEDAMVRSSEEHNGLKQKLEQEKNQRLESWSEREDLAIEIKGSGVADSAHYGLGIKADLEEKESGQDSSGLNKLRSQVEEESTDIDFDQELREVSQVD